MFLVINRKHMKYLLFPLCMCLACAACFFTLQTTSASSPQALYTVVLDAGHGGIDGGCSGTTSGMLERDLNLSITKKIESYLRVMGVSVVQTRTTEAGLYSSFVSGFKMVDMREREKIINKAEPDLVVSIHMNSFPQSSSRGVQTFFPPNSEQSKHLATDMQNRFVANIPYARSIPLVGDYYILQCNPAPAMLIECGFLSNPEEERLLQTNDYQEKLSYQIFCGIMHYFDIRI